MKKGKKRKKRLLNAKLMVVPVVAVVGLSCPVYSYQSFTGLILRLAGFVLLAASAMGRVWTSAYIAGKKNRELISSGPYSVVRNPLYLFSLMGFAGAGLAFGSIVLTGFFLTIFFLTHYPTIRREEEKLRSKFGSAFDLYLSEVPRLIPRRRSILQPPAVTLDPATFTTALIDSSLILLVFPAALILHWLHVRAVLPVLFHLY